MHRRAALHAGSCSPPRGAHGAPCRFGAGAARGEAGRQPLQGAAPLQVGPPVSLLSRPRLSLPSGVSWQRLAGFSRAAPRPGLWRQLVWMEDAASWVLSRSPCFPAFQCSSGRPSSSELTSNSLAYPWGRWSTVSGLSFPPWSGGCSSCLHAPLA